MRTTGSNGEETRRAIREAAVEVIAEHGFQAASLRLIAKRVGIRAPSLYNHIKSKERLLYELLHEPLINMIAQYRERTKGVDDPMKRLRALIQVHLDFHLFSRKEVFIGNMELRSLSKAHFKTITGLRDEYSNLMTSLIEDGAKAGVFKVDDPRVVTFAILSMLSGVCNWFRPDGRIGADEIIRIHTNLAFEMLGLDPESATAHGGSRPVRPPRAPPARLPRAEPPRTAAAGGTEPPEVDGARARFGRSARRQNARSKPKYRSAIRLRHISSFNGAKEYSR
ncbi:MAG TPA: TetR/AcrR family transcriptional regulator [Burkholderiaceae bacterium]|nr:TetR/AcrR family transcriptional regulator [Burkholderiaceae bacterium]